MNGTDFKKHDKHQVYFMFGEYVKYVFTSLGVIVILIGCILIHKSRKIKSKEVVQQELKK